MKGDEQGCLPSRKQVTGLAWVADVAEVRIMVDRSKGRWQRGRKGPREVGPAACNGCRSSRELLVALRTKVLGMTRPKFGKAIGWGGVIQRHLETGDTEINITHLQELARSSLWDNITVEGRKLDKHAWIARFLELLQAPHLVDPGFVEEGAVPNSDPKPVVITSEDGAVMLDLSSIDRSGSPPLIFIIEPVDKSESEPSENNHLDCNVA